MTGGSMRILLVSDWMSHAGGSEVYIVGLRKALREAGDDVRLLTCGAGTAGVGEADARAFGTDNAAAQTVLQLFNSFAARSVRRLVGEFQPEVALVSQFAYHLSPAVIAALSRVPTVVSVTDYKLICPIGSRLLPDDTICHVAPGLVCWRRGCVSLPHWLRDQPRYALLRGALERVDRIVCASAWVQGQLSRYGIAAEHVPPPVEAPSRGFHRAPSTQPTFVYVGRLSREKGLGVLLRAFACLRGSHTSARLRLVGDGPARAEVAALVESLGLGRSVELAGHVAPGEVEALMADAWALVAPSTWAEPFGLVAAEAIVRGVPVIATASGGFAETVEEGGTGILVPNDDEARLASALDDVSAGRAFATHTLRPDAMRRLADRLSPGRHVDQLHSVFETAKRQRVQPMPLRTSRS